MTTKRIGENSIYKALYARYQPENKLKNIIKLLIQQPEITFTNLYINKKPLMKLFYYPTKYHYILVANLLLIHVVPHNYQSEKIALGRLKVRDQ